MLINSNLEESMPSTRKSKSKAKKSTLMLPSSKKSRMNKRLEECNSTYLLSDDSSIMPMGITEVSNSSGPIVMSRHILNIMYRAVRGAKENVFPYVQQPVHGRRLIILAQYCIAREPRIGNTEREILKGINDNGYFDDDMVAWVDLVQLSSKTTNAVIDQDMLNKISHEKRLVEDFISRLSKHLEMYDNSSVPLVYIAGRPPRESFSKALDLGLIEHVRPLSNANQLSVYKLKGDDLSDRVFVVMEGRNHPSAHYYSSVKGRNEFKDTIGIIKGVAKSLKEVDGNLPSVTEDVLDANICNFTGMSKEDLRNRLMGKIFMTKLYGRDDGWLDLKHQHLCNVPAHKLEIQILLQKWMTIGNDVLMSILTNGTCYLDLQKYDEIIDHWLVVLGKDKFTTFMCDSVASRLGDETFEARLEHWYDLLGIDKFSSFMSNSMASRLGDEMFEARLEHWLVVLGKDKFSLFMCDSVASRLGDETFEAQLDHWLVILGKDKFTTFMCGSVASRLGDETFEARLEHWLVVLDKDKFTTFMCGSVASRLGDETFEARLEHWYDLLGIDKFSSFMSNSMASHLGDETFDSMLEKMQTVLDDNFVRIISLGSVACRIEKKEFTDMLAVWMEKLGSDFKKMMCNSFAKRFSEEDFIIEVNFWLEKMGTCFAKMMNDSVASHLTKPGMRDKMLYWHRLLGNKYFVTFAPKNIPAIHDDRSRARFMEWHQIIGNKKFHTFMSGGIGKDLLDNTMNQKIRQMYAIFGPVRSITLFCKGSFVKTVKNSADQLIAFSDTMNRDGDRIFEWLKKNKFKMTSM